MLIVYIFLPTIKLLYDLYLYDCNLLLFIFYQLSSSIINIACQPYASVSNMIVIFHTVSDVDLFFPFKLILKVRPPPGISRKFRSQLTKFFLLNNNHHLFNNSQYLNYCSLSAMPAKECNNSSIHLNNSDDEYVELELHSPEVILSSDEVILRSTISVDGQLLGLRVLNIIMSTISFSVMSKVLYTYVVDFKPRFLDTWTGGSFNYSAYQAVLSVGVIVCFANIVLMLLVLPYLAMMKPLHATCKITTSATTILIFFMNETWFQ